MTFGSVKDDVRFQAVVVNDGRIEERDQRIYDNFREASNRVRILTERTGKVWAFTTIKPNQYVNKFKQAREATGLSQEELALKSGVNLKAIRSLEVGKGNAGSYVLSRLSQWLNTPVDVMKGWN
ncbi:helix-turn-helix transcriptional regulator [Convivina intestini]|uniref:helix-turn-helix transcriptional regulator n=1 Tax=Convivina intestini TaxID=1505726 RepID=UPI00200D2257|nr:helix-turn-helix transcriptional regulator [Convivina intestini]CAH1857533.1 hypothetical protein R077811_01561 [Convivina intestini]